MLRVVGVSKISIRIQGVVNVDFKKIDPRIEHDGMWLESYPMQTSISVPKEHAEKIIAKLKSHDGITAVSGELTPFGIADNEKRLVNAGYSRKQ